MLDEQTIIDFNVRLCNIANESFSLVKKMHKDKLVGKIMRSIPKRFNMKAIVTKETGYSKDEG